MKIVIDTNFIIAAFISHGYCHELFDYFINSNHKLYTSDWILKEVNEKFVKSLVKIHIIIIREMKRRNLIHKTAFGDTNG